MADLLVAFSTNATPNDHGPKHREMQTLESESLRHWSQKPVCVDVPVGQIAADIASSKASGITEDVGKAIHSLYTTMPTQCFSCLPALQM
jgi:hypothetical protein|tara:strand:- start:223 stop:492 length:270 start_codon:yes stop_codon:yes gene_type:complete